MHDSFTSGKTSDEILLRFVHSELPSCKKLDANLRLQRGKGWVKLLHDTGHTKYICLYPQRI